MLNRFNLIIGAITGLFSLMTILIPTTVITQQLNIKNPHLFKTFIVLIIVGIFIIIELFNENKKTKKKLEDEISKYKELEKKYNRTEQNRQGLLEQNQVHKEEIKKLRDNNIQMHLLCENYKNTYEKTVHDTASEIEKKIYNILFLQKNN